MHPLPCHHYICGNCYEQWVVIKKTCPICRTVQIVPDDNVTNTDRSNVQRFVMSEEELPRLEEYPRSILLPFQVWLAHDLMNRDNPASQFLEIKNIRNPRRFIFEQCEYGATVYSMRCRLLPRLTNSFLKHGDIVTHINEQSLILHPNIFTWLSIPQSITCHILKRNFFTQVVI